MTDGFVIEPLSARHDRISFSCGVAALDLYLQVQAGQDIRRHLANCFVAVPHNGARIASYFTLAATSIPLTDIPAELSRKLPRYPVVPAVLVGRLAVDSDFAGRGLGSALLYDAIKRSLAAEPAAFAMVVDAKNESAGQFYRQFGFRAFSSRPLSFYLPLATAAKLMAK